MVINSRKLGQIEIDEEKIIQFDEGIIGFPSLKRFVLLTPADIAPFCYLVSVDDPDIALVVAEPKHFLAGYNPRFSEATLDSLMLGQGGESLLLTVIVVPQDPRNTTANLAAPILINAENRRACQEILNERDYSLRFRVFADASRG